MSTIDAPSAATAALPQWLALVQQQVESLSFGVVQIVVHDRRVTQIERTERTRLETPASGTSRRDNT